MPFLHFFDGFRTSHELTKVERSTTTISARSCPTSCVPRIASAELTPERPVIRGTAQNPDVYFQAREAANPFYPAARRRAGVMDALRASARAGPIASWITSGHPRPSACWS